MEEKARLIISVSADEPVAHRCSKCGKLFLFPEDRLPKQAAADLVAAFREHVRESHPEDAKFVEPR